MGKNIDIVSETNRLRPKNSEVERLWADTTFAKELFNWSPNFEGIEGFKKLKITVDWF